MQVAISGQGMKVGHALQEYVRDKVIKYVTKYFEQVINAQVAFHKHGVFYKTDIMVNEGTGKHLLIKGDAESDDVYAAFDMALVKIEKQLRRYKTKIKNQHKEKFSSLVEDGIIGTKYVITPFSSGFDEDSEQNIAEGDNPVIIAEKPANIEKLTVAEAVMKMDLNALPALVFVNRSNNCLNIVYHRADGNISWVDTKQVTSA